MTTFIPVVTVNWPVSTVPIFVGDVWSHQYPPSAACGIIHEAAADGVGEGLCYRNGSRLGTPRRLLLLNQGEPTTVTTCQIRALSSSFRAFVSPIVKVKKSSAIIPLIRKRFHLSDGNPY